MLKVLICNAGSTSLKFKLWGMPGETVLAAGRVERIGMGGRRVATRRRRSGIGATAHPTQQWAISWRMIQSVRISM